MIESFQSPHQWVPSVDQRLDIDQSGGEEAQGSPRHSKAVGVPSALDREVEARLLDLTRQAQMATSPRRLRS